MAMSAARRLVSLVWKHNREATGHSWQRLNSSMAQAVSLAITAGMRFSTDDFASIHADMRGGYWFGEEERFYGLAVEFDNLSACQSFEAWKARKPFVHCGRRVAVGSSMDAWPRPEATKDMTWPPEVTSFAADGASIIACTYKIEGERSYPRKIAKRLRITLEEIRAREREIEKAA